jgi:hypothetical protein
METGLAMSDAWKLNQLENCNNVVLPLSCLPSLVPMPLRSIITGRTSVSFLPAFECRTMMQ